MEGDKEKDLQKKKNVLDEEKDGIWREMYVENKSSRSWSPPAISPLTGIVVAEDTHVDGRKNGKGREFEIQRLKEIRKTALPNLPKQMNIISFLLANFENDKCPLKLCSSISYLLKCKKHMICISRPWMMMVGFN